MIFENIFLLSKFLLIIAFLIFIIASLRIINYKGVFNSILGADSIVVSLSVILVALGSIYGFGFFKDIALALVLLGVVGTVAFSTVMRRG